MRRREQVRAGPDNRLLVTMAFQGLSKAQAATAFKALLDFVHANPTDYEGQESLSVSDVSAKYLWNGWLLRLFARSAVEFDDRPSAAWTDFWWRGDSEQVGAFWHAYASAWLPATLLDQHNRSAFVDAWFAASRSWTVSLHFNKGLAGAPEPVIAAARNTPMNADVASAFALAITAAFEPARAGIVPPMANASTRAGRVRAAITALRVVAPTTGSYCNECDYFQADWQRSFWGDNYARLREIKDRYDPDGLFTTHHGVGSEGWSPDGFTRRD